MHIKSSVIIPTRNRFDVVQRAIKSVIALDKSNCVEIIVVDDGSDVPLHKFDFMREQDVVIRLDQNKGGAVARNVGIKNAKGEVIYLLDSDDSFLEMNFEQDFATIQDNTIYYTDIVVRDNKRIYPNKITIENFFSYIFTKYRGIGQTSTLMFKRNLNIFFDESLPKHQDWDLILFSCLLQAVNVQKKHGLVNVDKSDINSVSRAYNPNKSNKWLNKIFTTENFENFDQKYIELMCKSTLKNRNSFYVLSYTLLLFINFKIDIKNILIVVYFNFIFPFKRN